MKLSVYLQNQGLEIGDGQHIEAGINGSRHVLPLTFGHF